MVGHILILSADDREEEDLIWSRLTLSLLNSILLRSSVDQYVVAIQALAPYALRLVCDNDAGGMCQCGECLLSKET